MIESCLVFEKQKPETYWNLVNSRSLFPGIEAHEAVERGSTSGNVLIDIATDHQWMHSEPVAM